MIRKLGHLCFHTDNLDKMADFYANKLGLPIKFSFKNAAGQVFGHYFGCGDSTFVEIFDRVLSSKHWGGTPGPLAKGTQYSHFCLEVTGLAEVKAKLEARGVKFGEIRSGMDHSRQAWTSDPDGNAVEFMEYTSDSLQIQSGNGLVAV